MNLSRSDFNDLAAKALIRELTGTLGVATSAITIEAIRPGSVEVVLRFQDADALARFINRHVSGDPGLQAVFGEWKVQKVAYHAAVKDHPGRKDGIERTRGQESTSAAVEMWRKRLEYLLVEQAKASEATAKFKLHQDIEEARQKLRELGADR